MEVHGFTEAGAIDATIDGVRWTIPDDPTNTYRQLVAAWEAEGNTIPPYVAPAPAPRLPNLFPDQFWFGLRVTGHEADIRSWIDSFNDPESPNYDPVAWAAASAKLEYAGYFERDHSLVEAARLHLGLTVQELDDLWTYAALGLEPTAG